MNFLSHYYFDHIKNDPYFNFGLLLPDLARNFVPGTRVKPLVDVELSPDHQRLNAGCLQHVVSDKIFHGWEGFEDLMDQVKREFRKMPELRPERDWFAAHIFVELMIDHYLLEEHPDLATELYTSYSQLNMESVLGYLDYFDVTDDTKSRFQHGFERFMEFRYLHNYDHPDKIVYALERICTKMRISAFSERQKGYYMKIMSKLERNIVLATTELQTLLR